MNEARQMGLLRNFLQQQEQFLKLRANVHQQKQHMTKGTPELRRQGHFETEEFFSPAKFTKEKLKESNATQESRAVSKELSMKKYTNLKKGLFLYSKIQSKRKEDDEDKVIYVKIDKQELKNTTVPIKALFGNDSQKIEQKGICQGLSRVEGSIKHLQNVNCHAEEFEGSTKNAVEKSQNNTGYFSVLRGLIVGGISLCTFGYLQYESLCAQSNEQYIQGQYLGTRCPTCVGGF